MVKNGQNGQKMEFSGKWWENGVVIALSSFLFLDFIATAPSDNTLVNKWVMGSRGHPQAGTNSEKWPKKGQTWNIQENGGKMRC